MIKYLLPISVLLTTSSIAQQTIKGPDPATSIARMYAHPGIPIPCGGSANTQSADLNWQPFLIRKTIEIEHESPDQEEIERIKAAKLKIKMEYERTHPAPAEKTTSTTPVLGTNFAGNTYDFSSPLDNTMAISNGGIIVSVINSKIEYYNSTGGAATYSNSITSFLPFVVGGVCDPVVIYDPGSDRFIFFCQESPLVSGSAIFICFSKTNDPAAGWWCYSFYGDPTPGNNDGFDYPKLAINDSELFLTGNEYYEPSGTNHQSVIFQMDKLAGYAGGTLNYVYYSGITGSPFTILPVSAGQGTNITTGMVFVATHSSGGSDVDLYEVIGNWCCSPSLYYWNVPVTPYSVAANASQLGTSTTLNTGDCRTLSGFFLNGIIHYVFNSDAGSGYNGLNYNRMDVSGTTATNVSNIFSTPSKDNAYGSVVSFATTATDKSVMIGYGCASSAIYPQIRVVNCDNGMGWSASTLVKSSASYAGSSGTYRWGDYTGTSRKHNSVQPAIWMNGMYANSSNVWNTWIAEIKGSGTTGLNSFKSGTAARVYPNPVVNNFTIEFSLAENTNLIITVTDITGKVVKELYNGRAASGDNVFTFNKANLYPGTYFLNIRSGNQNIRNEKITIAD